MRAFNTTRSAFKSAAPAPPPPPPSPAPPPAPNLTRLTSPTLFADVAASTALIGGSTGGNIASAARGGITAPTADYTWGVWGPTYANVEASVGWAWTNAGGDWFNTAGTAQGTTLPHWTTVTTGAGTVSGITATAGAQAAWARGKWNAYIVKAVGGTPSIAALHHPTLASPVMNVTYTDATTATLACLACVRLVNGTAYSQVGAQEAQVSASVALEFQMPTKAVASASITLAVSTHPGGSVTLNGYMANPPVNTQPVVTGLASSYSNDIGISGASGVLFAQQFTTTNLADYVIPAASVSVDVFATSSWNPIVVGASATDDDTRLPVAASGVSIAGTNKWFYKQSTSNISVVASSYSGDGFTAPPSGQGALRIVTPGSSAADGAAVGNAGSLGSDLWALFSKADCGNVEAFTVRFYYRYHVGGDRTIAGTKMYRANGGGTASYAVPTGKFGPGGHCWTWSGGNNNVGGGNLGWSNRFGYTDAPADMPVQPRKVFAHVQDMIPGTNFPAGKDGGLGAALYPDTWYCIEVETILNTYNPTTGVASADGVMRIKVDGKLDATYTGWKFREGVLPTQDPAHLLPFRKIGATGVLLNDYNGGVMPPDRDLVNFYSNIVVTNGAAIGPVSVPINISGSNWTPNVDGSGNVLGTDGPQMPQAWHNVVTNKIDDLVPAGFYPSGSRYGNVVSGSDSLPSIIEAWGGGAWDFTNSRLFIAGGGHQDAWGSENGVFKLDTATMRFTVAAARGAYTDARYWLPPSGPLTTGTYGNGNNYPQANGGFPSCHSYHMQNIVPPSDAGNTNGWYVIYAPGNVSGTLCVLDLDTGTWKPAWWKNEGSVYKDFSYGNAFIRWPYLWSPALQSPNFYYAELFDLSQTESTTYNAASQGKRLSNAAGAGGVFVQGFNMPYGDRAFCKMDPRGEVVNFGASAGSLIIRRYRLDDVVAASSTMNVAAYEDTITLTGDTGDFTAANFQENGLGPRGLLWEAGMAYDQWADCIWIIPNGSGTATYKLSGLNGNTWTVTKYAAAGTLTRSPVNKDNGTFGRVGCFQLGGRRMLLRVVGTTFYTQARPCPDN